MIDTSNSHYTLMTALKITKAKARNLVFDLEIRDAQMAASLDDRAREALAKLCPVDMTPGAFEPGMFRRTRMAQIPAAIWMPDADTVHIVCFRSVAEYTFNLLRDAVAEGGEVGLFS
jgi:sarcosine oxidase subunit gamma